MEATDLLNTHVHVHRWSSRGPRVLLVHAIGFDHQTWDLLAPFLKDDYQLVGLDLPGHGKSDKPADVDYGVWSLGARVIKLLDDLGWDDAILVGNSLGGGTSLAVALQAPERVRGLALLGSVGLREGLPLAGRLAFLGVTPFLCSLTPALAMRLGLESARFRRGTVTRDRTAACHAYLRDRDGRAAFLRTLKHLYGPDMDRMAPLYAHIECPTLVIHGERDPLIRLWHAQRLAKSIPGAELARLSRCGHFPQEEAPDQVAAALRPFLERVTARTAEGLAANARE